MISKGYIAIYCYIMIRLFAEKLWWWNGENLQAVNPDPSTFLQLTLVGECCKAQCDTLLFNWTCSGIGDQWPLTFLQNTLWSLQICPRTICHLFKWICTMRKKVEKCTAGQSTWTLFSKQCCGDLDKCCFSWFVVRFCLSLQLPVEKIPNLVNYAISVDSRTRLWQQIESNCSL